MEQTEQTESRSSPPPVVAVEALTKRFGTHTVFEEISFEIPAGELVTIIGASGAGKSVLLKQLIGLARPTSGRVILLGKDLWHVQRDGELREIRRRIGVLFQNGALFSALSVRDNVAVPLREQAGLPPGLIAPIIDLRLLMCGLELGAGIKMPSELSGGMVKRAALARALALEPEVLFLDEPTSGLDPIHARAFDNLIRTLCDGLGLTVVIVTHDIDTVDGIADRVIILGEARILADGTPEEVSRSDHPWIQSYFAARCPPPRER